MTDHLAVWYGCTHQTDRNSLIKTKTDGERKMQRVHALAIEPWNSKFGAHKWWHTYMYVNVSMRVRLRLEEVHDGKICRRKRTLFALHMKWWVCCCQSTYCAVINANTQIAPCVCFGERSKKTLWHFGAGKQIKPDEWLGIDIAPRSNNFNISYTT